MKIRKGATALMLFVLCAHAQFQAIVPTALLIADVAKWAVDFWNYVKTGHQMVSTFTENFGETCYMERRYTSTITGRVIHTIPEISAELEEIGKIILSRSQKLEEMIKELKLDIDIDIRMFMLVQSMGVIDNLYTELTGMVPEKKSMKFVGGEYCSFAYRQIYGEPLSAKVDNMFNIIVPTQQLLAPLLTEIFQDLETNKETICNTGHSTLEYLHSIYTSLILVEIKAYVMTAFSHNLLFNFNGTGHQCEYHQPNPDAAIQIAQTKLRTHLKVYDHAFLKQMKEASREFRACDQGNDFIRDETYFELEGAIQGTIEFPTRWSDAILNRKKRMECETIDAHGTPDIYCDPKFQFCTAPKARSCRGRTHSCHTSSHWIVGCLAEEPPRRYDWLMWNRNKNKGNQLLSYCSKDLRMDLSYMTHSLPGVPWLDYSFNPCYCQCNDNDVDSISTHIFNLQWVESDISQNMVMTGVRFIVKNRVMQFQIQQGKLDDNFRVQEPEWKPVDDINEEIRAARMKRNLRGKWPDVVENRDFMIIKQSINNAIMFDTLHVPFDHVLTGVRFKYSDSRIRNLGNVEISLKARKFDHVTGNLCDDCEPAVVTSTITHANFHNYPHYNVDDPIYPTKPITSPGDYVKFEASDWSVDSAQTTLPFFDALPLAASPPTPLGGMGIYLKGLGDFSGIVSLKFVSLDYPMYMEKSGEDLDRQITALRIEGKN